MYSTMYVLYIHSSTEPTTQTPTQLPVLLYVVCKGQDVRCRVVVHRQKEVRTHRCTVVVVT